MTPATVVAKNELTSWIAVLLTISALALLPGYTDFAKKIVYLLDILAVYYFIKNRREFRNLGNLEKSFFIVIVINFLWIIFTYYINGSPGTDANFIWSRQFHLLFLIPLYFLYKHISISPLTLWISLTISVMVSFAVSLVDFSVSEPLRYGDRAHGGMHPVEYGYLLFITSAYLLYSAIFQARTDIKAASFLATLLALAVVVLTQSRGTWAALPVIPFLILYFTSKKWTLARRLTLLVLSLSLILAAYFIPIVKNRVDETIHNVESYLDSPDKSDAARETSIGGRFEMWKAGWQIFLENPVTGVGLGRYQATAERNAARYEVNPSAYRFYHPHNQYISALATRGFPGFLLILLIIILPIVMALKDRLSEDRSEWLPSMTMLTISLSFAIFGMADVPFESKPTILFYTIAMALLISFQKKCRSATDPKSDERGKDPALTSPAKAHDPEY